MPPILGPCSPWATVEDVQACGPCSDSDSLTDQLLEQKLYEASEILFELSGRQFAGECSDTVFVSTRSHWCWDRLGRITVGAYPLTGVTSITKADASIVDSSEYRIEDERWIARTDLLKWGRQELEIEFDYGMAPPAAGKSAAIALACELAKSCIHDECRLDRRVQNISRQGISIAIPGLVDALRDGRTGIPEIDLFLLASNPSGLRRRGRVINPDRFGRVTHRV